MKIFLIGYMGCGTSSLGRKIAKAANMQFVDMEIFVMKKKELKSIAKRIADAEYIIQTSDDKKAIAKAQETILELSGKAVSMEDVMAIDEFVQEILSQKT